MQTGQAYVLEALRRRASTYVLKQHTNLLLHAIGDVAQGRNRLRPPLSRAAVEDYARRVEAGIPGNRFVSVCSTGMVIGSARSPFRSRPQP
jgi:DNA-binding NarL/FixJ family response regulator